MQNKVKMKQQRAVEILRSFGYTQDNPGDFVCFDPRIKAEEIAEIFANYERLFPQNIDPTKGHSITFALKSTLNNQTQITYNKALKTAKEEAKKAATEKLAEIEQILNEDPFDYNKLERAMESISIEKHGVDIKVVRQSCKTVDIIKALAGFAEFDATEMINTLISKFNKRRAENALTVLCEIAKIIDDKNFFILLITKLQRIDIATYGVAPLQADNLNNYSNIIRNLCNVAANLIRSFDADVVTFTNNLTVRIQNRIDQVVAQNPAAVSAAALQNLQETLKTEFEKPLCETWYQGINVKLIEERQQVLKEALVAQLTAAFKRQLSIGADEPLRQQLTDTIEDFADALTKENTLVNIRRNENIMACKIALGIISVFIVIYGLVLFNIAALGLFMDILSVSLAISGVLLMALSIGDESREVRNGAQETIEAFNDEIKNLTFNSSSGKVQDAHQKEITAETFADIIRGRVSTLSARMDRT